MQPTKDKVKGPKGKHNNASNRQGPSSNSHGKSEEEKKLIIPFYIRNVVEMYAECPDHDLKLKVVKASSKLNNDTVHSLFDAYCKEHLFYKESPLYQFCVEKGCIALKRKRAFYEKAIDTSSGYTPDMSINFERLIIRAMESERFTTESVAFSLKSVSVHKHLVLALHLRYHMSYRPDVEIILREHFLKPEDIILYANFLEDEDDTPDPFLSESIRLHDSNFYTQWAVVQVKPNAIPPKRRHFLQNFAVFVENWGIVQPRR